MDANNIVIRIIHQLLPYFSSQSLDSLDGYGYLNLHGSQSLKEEGECRLMSSRPTNPHPLLLTRVLQVLV